MPGVCLPRELLKIIDYRAVKIRHIVGVNKVRSDDDYVIGYFIYSRVVGDDRAFMLQGAE